MSIKITVNDSQGLVHKKSSSGGVVGIKQARSASGVASGVSIKSSPITIPANSLITAYHVVSTSVLSRGAATKMGVRFGTSLQPGSHVNYDQNSIVEAVDNVINLPQGRGTSSDASLSVALDDPDNDFNNRLLPVTTNQVVGDSDIDIIGEIISGGAFGGNSTAQFIIEFITFS
jgi:hypothetical protein